MRVLILGGTAEARALAQALDQAGLSFLSSLAGRVSAPRLPVGEVRIGGFGGAQGLEDFLQSERVTHVIDATHPFATRMSANAVAACGAAGVPLLRFARPGWAHRPDAASWHWVDGLEQARTVAEGIGQRPFLTTGRQTLPAFASWDDRDVLVRIVEPLSEAPPPRWTVIRDRGPYSVEGELALLRQHRIDVVLTKDSGGSYTSAKLDACAQLGVPVVVVRRPGEGECRSVDSVAGALAWLTG
ncbi:MAG: cobalt-precorrin-6A reductase [Propionibacteriaceae bacterium]|nr:cobalt-precorrin-6A reductase [Propionibacteriaceae bacterium]